MVDPAFFNQRNQKRTGFFDSAQAALVAGRGVGVAVNGGRGGHNEDVARFGGGLGGVGSGFDNSDDGHRDGVTNRVQGKSGGSVAGDDEEVGALFVEELCAGDGIAGYGFVGFGAVGEAGGVAQVDVVGFGDEREKSAEDGETSEAGVEYAYGDGICQVSVLRSQDG